jgi:hypothetical protein
MTFTKHPRLLARIAGVFYLIITACALFAYMYVRGQVIVSGDMVQTATNLLEHERFYRLGFSAAVIVVLCNPPMGLILYELLKVVNPRLACSGLYHGLNHHRGRQSVQLHHALVHIQPSGIPRRF